jgi:transitional endoplasmic reticulum ATPase
MIVLAELINWEKIKMAKDNGNGTGRQIRNNMKGANSIEPLMPEIGDSNYHVPEKLKEDLEGIAATITNIDKFGKKMGHRNYLMSGPPGTGKTLGVQYLSTKLGIPIYDGKNVSNAQQIAQVYDTLRKSVKGGEQKAILVLDEVDRFSSRDDVVDPTQQQAINQLLAEMDGVDSNHGIFVFGMTNKPNKIDNALRRPGRFSKEIEFMPPNKNGREVILSIHAYQMGHTFEVDTDDLAYAAEKTFGYTGADLRGLLDEAFTSTVLRDKGVEVTREDFDKALKKTKPSALRDMPFREPERVLSDIGGYESHKEIMRRIFNKTGGSMSLFYGGPGTGKTDFAEALAGEYGLNFIVVSGSEPEDKFVGETGKKIDKYLIRAKQLAPCILLFDEMDALVSKKGMMSWKDSWTGLLQSKLSKPIEGVNIIGTMNRPDLISDTFLQRFPHRVYFGMPTPEEQAEIWGKYLPEGVDSAELVAANNRLTGRNIAHAVTLAREYDLEPSVEIYKHLTAGDCPPEDVDYAQIRKKVGDSVLDFNNVQKFLVSSGKGQAIATAADNGGELVEIIEADADEKSDTDKGKGDKK